VTQTLQISQLKDFRVTLCLNLARFLRWAAHFHNLLTNNSLSNDLARRLLAYKSVAAASNM
jgi:hypothetical protein